ncbi:MAG TPA: IS21-like element helper ATPase IstB [Chthonomonadaceae bacterium]|nr:IS21-like element helper ATPase IstB [Chthonomonadaceae bacterium]
MNSTTSALEHLHQTLTTLGLTEADAVLETHPERAAREDCAYADFLNDLLTCEVTARQERHLKNRLRQARLPLVKTLDQFDFAFQPTLEERQTRELKTLRFVHDASNVVFLGPPGVGKTHLAVGLAVEAIRAGYSALFLTAHELVSDLGKAAREGTLNRRLRALVTPKVRVIDEMGYLPLDEVGTPLFFQLVSARYERGSLLLTSNKSYSDWGHEQRRCRHQLGPLPAMIGKKLLQAVGQRVPGASVDVEQRPEEVVPGA